MLLFLSFKSSTTLLRHCTFEQDEIWLLLRKNACDYSRSQIVAFSRVQAGTVCLREVVQLKGTETIGGETGRYFTQCTSTWNHAENQTRNDFLARN